jgi:hypothetical protein
MRGRHKPLAEEADNVLQAAATFATASCPLWVPVVHPPATPAPTPEPDWRPKGFLGVVGDPGPGLAVVGTRYLQLLGQQVTPIGFGTTLTNAPRGTLTHLICT